MPFDLAVIDLDNTLYAADTGVFARMDKRMTAYVARELGVDAKEADRLRVKYWKEYGTTLRGMMLHHGMEPEGFLHDVHDIDAHEILKKDEELDAALARLPGRKVIHTNGITEHAERILAALGIRHHFERIYDIRFNDYIPKPCKETLALLIENEGCDPGRTLVVDDMADNLKVARELGCKTVWITQEPEGHWDFHIPRFHHLPDALRQ
ncbi:putative hydrolase of the HAD superfamily [Mariprofundus ferrinatatus]|uniref:Putative hydrolase of the HAD superfamily n=1 Tax=Mariprofundus ferrinatatus TaxID=1921087 RepID=A0A2K8LCK1_9PROT|nr:pyrimidine 5'-nucleotidase [Mariprofundus ferrinatatus]ATX82634.1 putative hydrolase of the HAD superfamily [Mariprofundus ferrinatatus]